MIEQHPFKWRHFEVEIILLCVRWYVRYALNYRDLKEIILERGLHVDRMPTGYATSGTFDSSGFPGFLHSLVFLTEINTLFGIYQPGER
jgi:hypothetical protein